MDGEAMRVAQRCEKNDLEHGLQDAYRTIRAFVGEPSESCASSDCPYERIVCKAMEMRP